MFEVFYDQNEVATTPTKIFHNASLFYFLLHTLYLKFWKTDPDVTSELLTHKNVLQNGK